MIAPGFWKAGGFRPSDMFFGLCPMPGCRFVDSGFPVWYDENTPNAFGISK